MKKSQLREVKRVAKDPTTLCPETFNQAMGNHIPIPDSSPILESYGLSLAPQ